MLGLLIIGRKDTKYFFIEEIFLFLILFIPQKTFHNAQFCHLQMASLYGFKPVRN